MITPPTLLNTASTPLRDFRQPKDKKATMDGLGDDDGMGFDIPMMNQQSQLFGYSNDDSQVPGMSAGSMYPDDAALAGEDANDAKRRRIARVRIMLISTTRQGLTSSGDRLATCAGRRRSSATARCPSVRTASTTRRTVSLHRSKRSGIPPKGRFTL